MLCWRRRRWLFCFRWELITRWDPHRLAPWWMASAFRSRRSAAAHLSIRGSSLSWSTIFCRRTESVVRGTTSSSLRISDPAGRRSPCWTVPCSQCRKTSFAWQHCDGVTPRLPGVPVRLSVPTKALGCGNTYLIQSIGLSELYSREENPDSVLVSAKGIALRVVTLLKWCGRLIARFCRNTRSWWPFNGFQLYWFLFAVLLGVFNALHFGTVFFICFNVWLIFALLVRAVTSYASRETIKLLNLITVILDDRRSNKDSR